MRAASYARLRIFAAVGDMTGDGFPDLVGQPRGGSMRIYPGNGRTGLRRSYVAHSPIEGNRQVGVGLWTSDGSPDTMVRRRDGSLVMYPWNGPGGLMTGRRIASVTPTTDWVLAVGDLTGDGRADLITRAKGKGRLWLHPSAKHGFARARTLATGLSRFDLAG
jgi:hypothetical protein